MIISTSLNLQKQIEEVAQHHNPSGYSLETTASFGQDMTFWTTQAPDALIIDLPDDDSLQAHFFAKLRKDLPANQAILFLCPSISPSLIQLTSKFQKTRILKAPTESFSFYRALVDLTREYQNGQSQVHPRYLTDQAVEVSSDYVPGRMKAVMRNLSLSGAYIDTDSSDFELKVGDLAKLSVFTGQSQVKQYVFDVKIVWSKKESSGLQGYGVTFVDKEEVYNQLLKNL